MAKEENRSDRLEGDAASDEATQLKKRARRRLIGATALALLAAIVLPTVMDHQPAPPLKDIQVRIPSPDEGVTARVPAKPISSRKEEKPAAAAAVAEPATREVSAPIAEKAAAKPEPKPVPAEAKPESKSETKSEAKSEVKPEPKPKAEAADSNEAWEVQLGAYQEPGRVKLLVGKLKELGVPTYTERVETANGLRIRVRAGPYPTQEAAEKARTRIKIVGVDGPVARKP